MEHKEINEIWEYLEDNGYFTYDELCLVTDINGYSIETLNEMIYARYGYRDFEQFKEYEEN